MTRASMSSEPEMLLRRLAREDLPQVVEDGSAERRERLVRSIGDSVRSSAERAERRAKWRRVFGGLAVAAALALAGGAWLHEQRPAPQISSVAGVDGVVGTVVVTQSGTRRVAGDEPRRLGEGDSVQTATQARAHLATAKSSVNLGESTELSVSQPSPAEERFGLRVGRVDVSVNKLVQPKRAVVVVTPDAEVVVRGTVFDVKVEPRGTRTVTSVHVTRGSVWVLSRGVQVALLSTGQSWSSVASAPVTPPVELTPSNDGSGSGQAAASPPVLRHAAAAPAEPTPVRGRSVASKTAAQGTANAEKEREARSGTLAEENRLFSLAIEARNRGDDARTVDLLGELLGTYPRTVLRETAQVERFRALERLGQSARAASEARRYLAEHADGVARGEARGLALGSKK